MTRSIDEINSELNHVNDYKQGLDEQDKELHKKAKALNVKERTRRLCTRGAMLETFLEKPGDLTNEQVMDLLKLAFSVPVVRSELKYCLENAANHRKPET